MIPSIVAIIVITPCVFPFPWCDDTAEKIPQPTTRPESVFGSLRLSIFDSYLSQRLFSTVPCIASGRNVDPTWVLQIRHFAGVLEGKTFWSAAVIISDTAPLFMDVSTDWSGKIDAGQTGTVKRHGSTNCSYQGPRYVGVNLEVRVIWYYAPGSRLCFASDSVGVRPMSLSY